MVDVLSPGGACSPRLADDLHDGRSSVTLPQCKRDLLLRKNASGPRFPILLVKMPDFEKPNNPPGSGNGVKVTLRTSPAAGDLRVGRQQREVLAPSNQGLACLYWAALIDSAAARLARCDWRRLGGLASCAVAEPWRRAVSSLERVHRGVDER